jgi:hypothetical protein
MDKLTRGETVELCCGLEELLAGPPERWGEETVDLADIAAGMTPDLPDWMTFAG